jgi:CRP-like cAMP-binding protein
VSYPPGTLLHTLGTADREALLALGSRRRFQPGETLINQGSGDSHAFVLLDGCTKVFGTSVSGRAVLLSIRIVGEVVGELSAVDSQPRSASVVAATAVVAQAIGRAAFLRYLSGHPAAAHAVQAAVVAELRKTTSHRVSVSGAPVTVRLARILGQLAESCGRPDPDGVLIEIPLSQPELASLIGVSEPTVHRALTELRAGEVVRTRYRRLVISDPAALRAMVAGDRDAPRM